MLHKKLLAGLILAALLLAGGTLAQTPQPPAEPEEELQAAPIDTPPAGAEVESELIVGDAGADPAPDDEEESDRRFIPTEEISQDLGVSFPVDI